MPKFRNKLDELLADAVLASGQARQTALDSVRGYLRATPIVQLKLEIAQLQSLQELNMLQAAGVPLGLRDTFSTTYELVQGRLK